MRELTEQEEQEMIARARAGDPEANYTMSLWALDRAKDEPGEERWSRLAAKCLVKSAQAGYVPAQKRMAELMNQTDPVGKPESADEPEPVPEDDFDWSTEPDEPPARPASRSRAAAGETAEQRTGSAPSGAAAKLKGFVSRFRSDGNVPDDRPAHGKSRFRSDGGFMGLFNFSQWDDRKWKKMRLVCSGLCVVLAVLIGLMIVTGKKTAPQETPEPQIPAAATAAPVETTPTPTPVPAFPDEATRTEIEAADLDIFPGDEDYLSELTTATVTAGSGLKLRRGPNTSYNQILLMEYNSKAEVYAARDDWSFVKYTDGTWGWCSSDYLK